MKISKYNFYLKKNDAYIGINLKTLIPIKVNCNTFNILSQPESNINIIKEQNPSFFNLLLKLGFIILDDHNEQEELIIKHRLTVYSTQGYRLTIVPTLGCNLRCWYCYEEHFEEYMDEKNIDTILKFVESLIKNNNLKTFHLDWFGGEPMLCFKEIIYPLSQKIKELCEKHNILFRNSITTNGVLIDQSIVEAINDIQLYHYQITLDGGKEEHNRVRKTTSNEGTFNRIINNINLLLENLDNVNITLRINYTKKNLPSIGEIIDYIPPVFRKRVTVAFQQVWQTKVNGDIDSWNYRKKFECNDFRSIGVFPGVHCKCYADLFNQCVILPNYDVFKCTARDFKKHPADGFLSSTGRIHWNSTFHKRLSKTTIERKICLECDVLPVCWGPCSQKLIEAANGKESVNECSYKTHYKSLINNIMLEYCDKISSSDPNI